MASEGVAANRRSRRPRLILAAILAVVFLVVLRPPRRVFTPDQAIYALVGSEMLHGAVLYRDVWELKGPAVSFFYAGLMAVLGYSPPLFDLFSTAWVLFVAFCAFLLARRLWDSEAAGIGAGGMVAFACVFPPGRHMNAELIALPFVLVGVHSLLVGLASGARWRLAAAGACLTIAALTKAVFCLDVVAAGTGLLVWACSFGRSSGARRGRMTSAPAQLVRAGALVLAGSIVALLPFGAYFAAHNALGSFWDSYVQTNFAYVQHVPLRETLRGAVRCLEGEALMLGGLWGLALGGLVAFRARRHPLHERVLLPTWLLMTALGVAAGRHFFPHYLMQMVGPASVLAGWSVAAVGRALRAEQPAARDLGAAAGLCLLVFAAIPLLPRAYNAASGWRSVGQYDTYTINEVRTAEYLQARTEPGDRIFAVGINAQLNLMTGLRPASRFIDTGLLATRMSGGPSARRVDASRLWREDVERTRPTYVIVSNYNRALEGAGGLERTPEFQQWLREHYEHETTLRGSGDASAFYNELYRRRDGASSEPR